MWVIHSRDTWMHRLDICRATGRSFEQTAEHDGRIAELVMLDVAKALTRKLEGKSIAFDLTGSGNETSAHLQENGRIVFMFCAFDGPPNILRLTN